MNTDMRFPVHLSWGNSYPWETYITDVNVASYGSDICLGEQISLGKCVRGHTFPGGTYITVTPGLPIVHQPIHTQEMIEYFTTLDYLTT